MKKKFLLYICSFLFVLQIDAGWRDQWVQFKSLFTGFSIKKPILTRKQVVIGGVGALAVAGAAWWWFKRVSKKSSPQENNSLKKNEEQSFIIPKNIEISDLKGDIVIQKVDINNTQVNNSLLREEVILEDLTENIKNDIDTAQELYNISSTINTPIIKEEKQKVKETEKESKIAQKYQQMNQAVDTKKAMQLIDNYEKQKELTNFDISELKKEFEKLDSTIPKSEMPLWKSIKGRYNVLISTKK